jgi:hypothetical protein
MRIMIDNSVWVRCTEAEELLKLIQQIIRKHELRTSEITEEEIQDSIVVLNAKTKGLGDKLRSIYTESKPTGIVKLSDVVEELANKYLSLLKLSKKKAKEVKSDLRLAACATLDSVDYVLTFNKKTLASEEFQLVYRKVNDSKNLRTPLFLTEVESFRRLLLL